MVVVEVGVGVPDVGALQLMPGIPGEVPAMGDVSAPAAVGTVISSAPIALATAAHRGRAVMGHLLLALLGEGERRVAACPAYLTYAPRP